MEEETRTKLNAIQAEAERTYALTVATARLAVYVAAYAIEKDRTGTGEIQDRWRALVALLANLNDGLAGELGLDSSR